MKFSGIKYKYLLATFSLLSAFAFVTDFAWYTNLTEEAEKQTESSISTIVQNSNRSFESYTKEIDDVAALLTTHSSNYLTTSMINLLSPNNNLSQEQLYQSRVEAGDFLISLCSFKKYLTGLTASDLNGNTMTYGITTSGRQLQKMPWYRQITGQSENRPVFIPPYYINNQKEDGDKAFAISRPVMEGNREIGFILAEVNCDIFSDTFNTGALSGMSLVVLDGSLMQTVYESPGNSRAFDLKALAGMLAKRVGEDGSFYATVGQSRELVVYHHSDFTGWTSLGIIPQDIIMKNFNHTRNGLVLFSVVFCLFSLLLVYMLSDLLTKNLLRLNTALTRIDKDNLDIRVKIRSHDEIAQIYGQFNLMLVRIRQLIADNKEIEKKKRIADLQALQAQITPHFLYNTLNTIRFLAALQGSESIQAITENLSQILHVNMDARSFIPVPEELELIRSYLDIQQYRYSNKYTYEIQTEGDLEENRIPKFVLQPIVENALLHGIFPLKRPGIVLIQLMKTDGVLRIRVKDNGVGMSESEIEAVQAGRGASIGIKNVVTRIKTYFGSRCGLTIQSEPGLYTSVEIELPALTREDMVQYE